LKKVGAFSVEVDVSEALKSIPEKSLKNFKKAALRVKKVEINL